MLKKSYSTACFISRSVLPLLLLLLTIAGSKSYGQLITSNTQTPAQLVQNVLLGPGVIATNITYTGGANAIGHFTALGTNLGIDSGLVLTTGSIFAPDGPQGPNTVGGNGTDNMQPGDANLDALVSPNPTFNATVLEFDFVPQADTVKFRYVFGSEEYPEYVNSAYNDVFAFWLSGISVPLPPTNIALIPSTTTPVTINNLNCQNNSPYYICNDPNNSTAIYCPASYNCPSSSAGTTIDYDGFTTVLTAIYPVVCGETYHIKIAIADVGDGVLDSGVFLEAGSFSSDNVSISSEISYGGLNDSTLYESCGQACVIFYRGQQNINNPDTLALNITGSATNGVDYTLIPDTVFFAPGQDSVIICIQAPLDAATEGVETLNITALQQVNPCVQSSTDLTIYIGDFEPLTASASNTFICPGNNAVISPVVTGGVQPYSYSWSTGPTTSSIVVSPTATTTYSVTINDVCNSPQTSAAVTVTVPAALSLVNIEDVTVCAGIPVSFSPLAAGGVQAYTYSWQTISGPDTITNPGTNGAVTFVPTAQGTFQLTLTDSCGETVTDQVIVNYEGDCGIWIPNVFTPNGDQSNQTFTVYNLEKFPNSQVLIYNRWGNLIYESDNYQNDWDGKDVSDGVYYYILNVSDGSAHRGFVTILR